MGSSLRLLPLALLLLLDGSTANYPLFDESTKMRLLLVPADTPVGTIIYRLRATDADFDFPLAFDVLRSKNVVRLETLPCARNHSACEANVVLSNTLRVNTDYNFGLEVRDARGDSTRIEATIRATSTLSVAAINTAFPYYKTLIMVPENTRPGTELDYILVRKNDLHGRHAYLELSGSPIFSLKQRLAGPEVSNGTIILNDDLDYEKQNLYPLLLYATDPYVSTRVDTRNVLGFNVAIAVSDVQDTPPVFTKAPPVTSLAPRVRPGDVILQVQAEDGDKGRPRDIRYGLLSEGNPYTPFFSIDEDTGEVRLSRSLSELRAITPPGHPVRLSVLAEEVIPAGEPDHEDSSSGLGAVFALSLQNDNGTFEISPTVAEGSATDMNDNAPRFQQQLYTAQLPENVTAGTLIAQVHADDLDTGKMGQVRYTRLLGQLNGSLAVDPETGWVSVATNNHGLDHEAGEGQATTVPFIITLIDINDHTPATDADAEAPNNEIRYEIMSGNVGEKFHLDEITGVPHRWSRADVRVHSAGSEPPVAGSVVFIVPKSPTAVLADPRATERFLAGLTGGRVVILANACRSVVVALVTYAPGEPPSVVDIAQIQQRLMANQTSNTVIVKEYRADSSALFWFLLFLALLLAIAILVLITCFFHSGCPLYYSRKERREPRSAEEVRLVLERGPPRDDPDKLIIRREAWSADGGTRRYLQFNRRNILTLDPRPTMDDGRGGGGGGMAPVDNQHVAGHPPHEVAAVGPSIIYTRDIQQQQLQQQQQQPHRKHRDVYLEDVESEYPPSRHVKQQFTARDSTRSLPTMVHTHPNIICIKDRDGNRIFVHQEESADEIDSMRRHEMERGSDLGQVRYVMRERSAPTTQHEPEVVEVLTLDEEEANGREQHYVKAGNAEVLRLLTHNKADDRHGRSRRVNQTDAGKDIIMRRFMEDQRHHSHIAGDIPLIQLPGQVHLQMGTQTDEERGTQTENDSLNSSNDTPPHHEHAKHVIKTPILEENESSLEQIAMGSRSIREHQGSTHAEAAPFQTVDEIHEKSKAETEFNYGDTKATMLRRKINYEKNDADSPDENKKGKGEREYGTTTVKVPAVAVSSSAHTEGDGKPHRSQSLPRNVNDTKRRRSLTESQKLSRQKSSSINSGLDKASRVTFASPNHSLSDDEFAAIHHKKAGHTSGTNSLRASNTSLNTHTPKHRKNRKDSISDDEKTHVQNKAATLRRASSNANIHKASGAANGKSSNRERSVSDDESNVTSIKTRPKKTASTLKASNTSVKASTSSARSVRKSRDDASDDEKVKKSTNSLRITKASSSRKSISPAPKTRKIRREGSSFSDEESEKHKNVKPRVDSRRGSTSLSPAVRIRKSRHENDSDHENETRKIKVSSKTNSNLKKTRVTSNGNQKKQRNDETEHKTNGKHQRSHHEQRSKSPLPKEQSQKNEKGTNKNISKSEQTKESRKKHKETSDVESDGEFPAQNLPPKHILHSGMIKARSPTYEARVKKLDDGDSGPDEDGEEDDEDNVSVLLSPNFSQEINASNISLQSNDTNQSNQSNKSSSGNSNATEHSRLNGSSNSVNEVKNSEKKLQKRVIERVSSTTIVSEIKEPAQVHGQQKSSPPPGDAVKAPVAPIVTVDAPVQQPPKFETAMQTDVTLVPLINSLQGRGGMDDDLDSGIAMSQTNTDGRSRRLNQLTEKKSIFTIAYDDMQTKQIRADRESGRQSLAPNAKPPPTPRVPNAPGSSQQRGPRGLFSSHEASHCPAIGKTEVTDHPSKNDKICLLQSVSSVVLHLNAGLGAQKTSGHTTEVA
ncbi:hypothetical protein B566_EDAN001192, partial [Ephemera danica]